MSDLGMRAVVAHVAAVMDGPRRAGLPQQPPASQASRDELVVALLLEGDEDAFHRLVSELQPLLLRLAMTIVRGGSVAEEVVQDTWLAVMQGLPQFAGRSSLKTWIVRILFNRARTRAVREARSVPFSALGSTPEDAAGEESFALDGSWRNAPRSWDDVATPERMLSDAQTRMLLEQVIEQLPPQQRLVIELRDIAELESGEVCEILDLSEANQRVLLHRARLKVRTALAQRLAD